MPASFLLLALAAGPLSAQGPRAVARTFTSELELVTDSFEIEASQEEKSFLQQGPRYQREEAYEIELEDELLDDEQPPAKFTRTYRTVTSTLELSGEKAPLVRTASAGLEGRRVIFERGEDGRYLRTCADADVRQGQLNRLRADLSLARFLPLADGPDEPASSTLAFAEFARILAPLQEGARRPRKKAAAPVGGLNVAPSALLEPIAELMAGAEGELTVTPRARAEDDELPGNADLGFSFEGCYDGSAGLLAGAGEAEDEVVFSYEGTGTLAWDAESGRIEIRCQGEVRLSERFVVRVSASGREGAARGRLQLTGTLELEATEE